MNLKIPHFYLEMLRAWQEIRKCRFPDIESLNPIIFNNRNILLKGKIIFVKSVRKINERELMVEINTPDSTSNKGDNSVKLRRH